MARREERPIPWWEPSNAPSETFSIVRPLLGEPRATIEAYLASEGLTPLEDASNASVNFDRNWIRHQVLPAVLQRWPAAIDSIGRMTGLVRADVDLLDHQAKELESSTGDRSMCTDTLRELPAPIARRLVHGWLCRVRVADVSSDVVARCYELALTGDQGRVIEAGNGTSVVLADGCLTTLDELFDATVQLFPMAGPGGLRLWNVSIDSGPGAPDAVIEVQAEAPLEVRTVQRGDRWLGSKRSVFEDLRAQGIHPLLRSRVLAVFAGDRVLLIPAIYPTIHARPTGERVRKVEVRWRKLA
jgi:hypothetical protein